MVRTYAHRGLHDTAPENTMASFLRAEMAGVDGIETDLRTTADGHVVLFHDRTFAGRALTDYTYADLRQATGLDVPLLEHVLERSWRVSWNFEIKTRAAGSLAAVLLRDHAPHDTLISSFDHEIVEDLVEETGLGGALLVASLPSKRWDMPLPTDLIRTMVWDWNVARPDGFGRADYVGWRNMVYGPVTADEHRAIEILRPWGVITDYPGLMTTKTEE